MRKRLPILFLALLLILSIPLPRVRAQDPKPLTIYAASSLTDAFQEIAADFTAINPDTDIIFNFGSSSQLVAQLKDGAPADLFASANTKQLEAARAVERISGDPTIFAKNRLILIVPAANPAHIESLHDLSKLGIKLVVAAPGVPVRDYTETMLTKLETVPDYGTAYKAAFLANIVSEESNVRQVSAKVALGEADAGIVYQSDVTPDLRPNVIALTIPTAWNTVATYPIALTNNAADPELANAFVNYLVSDEGQNTLEKWGFISIRIPKSWVLLRATEG
jgi:molybdate transport system substrate-binding protein